jgi:tetratricopeptide (TPR) repeat protein
MGPMSCTRLLLLLILAVGSHPGSASARPRGLRARIAPRAQLQIAERLLREGRYAECLAQLEKVPSDPELRTRVWLVGALARYKLGELDRAEQLASQLLQRGFSSEAQLLVAMVAFRRGQWDLTLAQLDPVLAAAEQPWAGAAARLAGEASEQKKKAEEQRRRTFTGAIDEARAALQAREIGRAARALDYADRTAPGQMLTQYYRGFLGYRQGDFRSAERWLRTALAASPGDAWSSYMLALTQAELGDTARARARLLELTHQSPDAAVRRLAGRALAESEQPAARPRAHAFSVRLEAGLGLDTNPAFIDESKSSLSDAGLALQVASRLGYERRAQRRPRLGISLSALERNYAIGDSAAAQTELGLWTSLAQGRGRLELGVSAGYTFSLLGHSPMISLPSGEISAGLELTDWLRLLGTTYFGRRIVHASEYPHLEAWLLGGTLGPRLVWRRLEVELSYAIEHDWASAVLRSFGGAASDPDSAVLLWTGSAHWSHSGRLAMAVALPWKLRLTAGAGITGRLFAAHDTLLLPTSQERTLEPRRDIALLAEAELARSLRAGLELALRYESIDNFSNTRIAEVGLDHSYSRRQVSLILGWAWATP